MSHPLQNAIAQLINGTPAGEPWTARDIHEKGIAPIDESIAIILNAVISGDLAPAPAVVLPDDIAAALISIGKAEWGGPEAQSDEDHTKGFANSLRLTREHFGMEGPQVLHGLYVEGTSIVLCHTGTSPNSAIHARTLTGAWNWLHGIAAAQIGGAA